MKNLHELFPGLDTKPNPHKRKTRGPKRPPIREPEFNATVVWKKKSKRATQDPDRQ
jgi:hypothetical protein